MRVSLLALLAACGGPPVDAPATCEPADAQVRQTVQGWIDTLPPGQVVPDVERTARLPPAAPSDVAPALGHAIHYDPSHPSGDPVWVMGDRAIAEPGMLPDLPMLTQAMAELDAREGGEAAPLVVSVPASAPLEPVMALLGPLAAEGWTRWNLVTVTGTGRALTPVPEPPAGLEEELAQMTSGAPMGVSGGVRSQAAMLYLFRTINSRGCDTRSLSQLLKGGPDGEKVDAATSWGALMDLWTDCGCPLPAEQVRWLAYEGLSEHGMRHLGAVDVEIDDQAEVVAAQTWGGWIKGLRGSDASGPLHTALP